MSASLLFNVSFDLGGISLILFVVWFFVNFNNSEAAFKWFSLSILALLASVIILSYGSTKLSRARTSLPSQNESEIMDLKQEVSTLKSKRKHANVSVDKKSSKKNKSTHHESKSSYTKLPDRIVNQHDNDLVKKAVAKHERHIHLIARVTNSEGTVMVRGVHSDQIYKLKGSHNPLTVNEFVVVKGTATGVNDNVISVTATSVKKQGNS